VQEVFWNITFKCTNSQVFNGTNITYSSRTINKHFKRTWPKPILWDYLWHKHSLPSLVLLWKPYQRFKSRKLDDRKCLVPKDKMIKRQTMVVKPLHYWKLNNTNHAKEKFQDTKGVISGHKEKKDRQPNEQKRQTMN